MSDKMRNIPEKGKSTETPEQTLEKVQEQLAQKKFDQLVTLSKWYFETVQYSTREPDALSLSIKTEQGTSDISFPKRGSKMIEYTKIIKPKTLQFSSRELKAQLISNDNGKEYEYVSYIRPNVSNDWIDSDESFPGTNEGRNSVVISTEKAIKIMDRMIQEIEAAKKCVPIWKSRELLSELKQDVWEIEARVA